MIRCLLLLLAICCSEGLTVHERHFPFIQEASSVSQAPTHDYIIIGGGGSGCALAATLSSHFKVLLLERGASPYENSNLTTREGFDKNFVDIYRPDSPMQMFTSTEGTRGFRARVLGGGTSVNAGFYSRASQQYIRNAGWDEQLAESSYRWVEDVISPSILPPETYQAVVREALLQAGVTPDNGASYEHLVGTKTSGTSFDGNGYRRPSPDLFHYADPDNLDVFIHATVHRILFKGLEAYGVLYADSLGVQHVAEASCEVILSAGALGSPQLLLLSGVGPKQHLVDMGVPVVLDLPGVGQHVADNPQSQIRVPSPSPITPTSREQVAGITRFGSFIEGGSRTVGVTTGYVGAVVAEVSGPASRGYLELNSLDPGDNPKVTYNYFEKPQDLELCIAGVNMLEEMILSDAFEPYRFGDQVLPSNGTVAMPRKQQDEHRCQRCDRFEHA